MIDRGWIYLYQCNQHFDNCEEIDAVSVEEILSNPVSWYPEYGEIRIVLAATEDGERAYMSGTF